MPLTFAAVGLVNSFLPAVPIALNLAVAVSGRVVAFALGVSLVAAVVFGVAPARHALGLDLAPLLHGANATADRRRLWLRHALVVFQVALSLMLVVTAGLFVRTLQAAARVDPGFTTSGVVLANVDVALAGVRDQAAVALVERYITRLAALPGVSAVAAARMVPLQGSGFGLGRLRVASYAAGRRRRRGRRLERRDAGTTSTSCRMPIVEGRGLSRRRSRRHPRAWSSSTRLSRVHGLARTQRRRPGRAATADATTSRSPLEVVGVVADARYRYISDAPEPFVFVPLAQHPVGDVTFFVRHERGVSLDADVRTAMAQVEPSRAGDVRPVVRRRRGDRPDAAAPHRLGRRQRRRGRGRAGGARPLRPDGVSRGAAHARESPSAWRWAPRRVSCSGRCSHRRPGFGVCGAAAGLGLAAGVGALLRPLLVGVAVVDVPSAAAAVTLFVGVLAAASWGPARRAATTDPAGALRAE